MCAECHSDDLVLTKQDFLDCGWKEAMSNCTREGYSALTQGFTSAGRQAEAENRELHANVLLLLADACSMILSPKSPNEPFKTFFVFSDRRGMIPDDLTESNIEFLAQIADEIEEPRLKARIADLVWLRQRPRDVKFAIAAIDAYRLLPLDADSWVQDGRECWGRALSLARMLNTGAGNRIQEMEGAILQAFSQAAAEDGFLAVWLAELLKEYGLGRSDPLETAQKLESLARHFDAEGEYHHARDYYGAASYWFILSKDEEGSCQMTAGIAECWVKEAEARLSGAQASHMVAASHYEKAIQIYRTIPRSRREKLQVEERMTELYPRLKESGEKSLDEMMVISSGPIDLEKFIESSRDAVRGKSPMDALMALCNICPCCKAADLRINATKTIRNNPIYAMSMATIMSRDGRAIGKRPGLSLGDGGGADDEAAIRAEMIRDHGIDVDIRVRGGIVPALEVLLLEHRLREIDFASLAAHSPIVPPSRSSLFGKALFAGFDYDFVTALHFLVPQIENMVRFHLKQAGVKTTNLDQDGIENENGLSALMDVPEVTTVFGEDLAFEIRALFCDPFGPNLRNELAHGLLDEAHCNSTSSIYAWWLGLRLVFNTYSNAARKITASDEACEGE